jgi:ABC-type nitrate/sulfonate/bicarbonate transport system ATPase subunit
MGTGEPFTFRELDMIRLLGVTKSYAEARSGARIQALDGFDLEVTAGEFVAILGPSGSGKSTVLKLIAGFDTADSGTVEVGGEPVTTISPRRVLVAQDAALFPWLNVIDNIAFGPRAQGRGNAASITARVHDLVQALGLAGAERRLPSELSGGMKQRVALARALAVEPEVLLLDEPFAALDALSRERLQDALESAWITAKPTVVLVTHSVDEAIRLADRVVIVSERPARIVHTAIVNATRPRDIAGLGDLRRTLAAAVRGLPHPASDTQGR